MRTVVIFLVLMWGDAIYGLWVGFVMDGCREMDFYGKTRKDRIGI